MGVRVRWGPGKGGCDKGGSEIKEVGFLGMDDGGGDLGWVWGWG